MTQQNSPNKKPKRSLSKKVLKKKELKYKGALAEVNKSKEKIQQYENIIEDKQRIDHAQKEGDKPVFIPLLPTEVKHYRFLLKAEKLNLKKNKGKLKNASEDLDQALKHQSEVILSKTKKIDEKDEAERKAKREKDPRTNLVIEVVKGLKKNSDPRFTALTDALNDGRQFRKELDVIIKEVDNETYISISGLSSVKTSAYNAVKDELLKDDNSDAPAVTAG